MRIVLYKIMSVCSESNSSKYLTWRLVSEMKADCMKPCNLRLARARMCEKMGGRGGVQIIVGMFCNINIFTIPLGYVAQPLELLILYSNHFTQIPTLYTYRCHSVFLWCSCRFEWITTRSTCAVCRNGSLLFVAAHPIGSRQCRNGKKMIYLTSKECMPIENIRYALSPQSSGYERDDKSLKKIVSWLLTFYLRPCRTGARTNTRSLRIVMRA